MISQKVPIAMVLISRCEKIYRFSILSVLPYGLSQFYIVWGVFFLFKQYFIHIQSELDQAAGLAYFNPLPISKAYQMSQNL
jgi:hypothetical protein